MDIPPALSDQIVTLIVGGISGGGLWKAYQYIFPKTPPKTNLQDVVNNSLKELLGGWQEQQDVLSVQMGKLQTEVNEQHAKYNEAEAKHNHCQRNLTITRTLCLVLGAELKDLRQKLNMPEPDFERLLSMMDEVSREKMKKLLAEVKTDSPSEVLNAER